LAFHRNPAGFLSQALAPDSPDVVNRRSIIGAEVGDLPREVAMVMLLLVAFLALSAGSTWLAVKVGERL
jgi:hypothetical protein